MSTPLLAIENLSLAAHGDDGEAAAAVIHAEETADGASGIGGEGVFHILHEAFGIPPDHVRKFRVRGDGDDVCAELRELLLLLREIREELGCDLVLGPALPRFTHDYGAVVIEMIPFLATLAAGSPPPHPHEHVALVWAEPAVLPRYDLAPADIPILAML